MEKHIQKDQLIGTRNAGWLFLPIFGDIIEYVDDDGMYSNIHGPGCIELFENKKIHIKTYYHEYNIYNEKLMWQNHIKDL
jgi:hypothetical protein